MGRVAIFIKWFALFTCSLAQEGTSLTHSEAALKAWNFVNGHRIPGVCFNGKNQITNADHHCETTDCIISTVGPVSLTSIPFQRALDERKCAYPMGGQLPAVEGSNVHVSFIMPVHNDASRSCLSVLELFKTSREAFSVEYVVADDSSTMDMSMLHNCLRSLHEYFGQRTAYTKTPSNCGFGCAVMNGFSSATGEYIVVINSDALVINGWLHSILETFAQVPEAALVGPLYIGENNMITESGGLVYSDGSAANLGRFYSFEPQFTYMRRTDYVSAACIVLRSNVFKELGFDPRYGMGYYEDTDLALAIQDLGYLVLVQPTSVVYHQEGGSFGDDTSPVKQKLMQQNHQVFFEKWAHTLAKHSTNVQDAIKRHYRYRVLFVGPLDSQIKMLMASMLHMAYHVGAVSTHTDDSTVMLQHLGIQVDYSLPEQCDFHYIVNIDGALQALSGGSMACPDVPVVEVIYSEGALLKNTHSKNAKRLFWRLTANMIDGRQQIQTLTLPHCFGVVEDTFQQPKHATNNVLVSNACKPNGDWMEKLLRSLPSDLDVHVLPPESARAPKMMLQKDGSHFLSNVSVVVALHDCKHGREVVFHAMSVGIPVISTADIVWSPDVADMVNMRLVSSQEHVGAAVQELVHDQRMWSTISKGSRLLVASQCNPAAFQEVIVRTAQALLVDL